MREILFRGKTKDNYWAIGVYASHISSIYDLARKRMYKVIPETVGQYTGLTDKNGRRIFEGDIIKYIAIEDYASDWKVSTVVYGDKYDYPAFDIDKGNDFDCNALQKILCSGDYDSEIIGNTHDNPELLEKKK